MRLVIGWMHWRSLLWRIHIWRYNWLDGYTNGINWVMDKLEMGVRARSMNLFSCVLFIEIRMKWFVFLGNLVWFVGDDDYLYLDFFFDLIWEIVASFVLVLNIFREDLLVLLRSKVLRKNGLQKLLIGCNAVLWKMVNHPFGRINYVNLIKILNIQFGNWLFSWLN